MTTGTISHRGLPVRRQRASGSEHKISNKKLSIKRSVQIALTAFLLLVFAFVGFRQESVARGFDTGSQIKMDRQALAMTARARVNLVRRLGVDANRIVVQSVEPAEFPNASLGAPEANRAYPLVATTGYNIRLLVNGVVYRYWAADGRVVYVGSFIEPSVDRR